MNGLYTIFASALLIMPGFLPYSLLMYIIGHRVREFSASIIWSIAFVAFSFGILSLINIFLHIFRIPFQFDVNSLANLSISGGNKLSYLSFSSILLIFIQIFITGALLSILFGYLLKYGRLRFFLERFTGHSIHMDVWNDFFIDKLSDYIIVITKDDQEYAGILSHASENPNLRSITLKNVKFRDANGVFQPYISNSLESLMYIEGENIQRIFQIK